MGSTHHHHIDLNVEAWNPYSLPSCWRQPGVYQFFVGDQSYIGKSRNVRQRLVTHKHKYSKLWTRCRVLSLFDEGISAKDLNNAEAYWIDLLRPQLNLASVVFQ